MVVLETATIGGSLLGGPYAQGAPALKMVPKRYLGLHQWLGPVCTKELKEQIVSLNIQKKKKKKINCVMCWRYIYFSFFDVYALERKEKNRKFMPPLRL